MKVPHPSVPRKVRIEHLVPGRWACAGTVEAGALARLAGLCAAGVSAERVMVELRAVRTPARRTGLVGRLSGSVPLRCERCLGVCRWDFNLPVALCFVPVNGPVEADGDFELCEREDGTWLELWTLLEDEILLAVPIAPRHAEGSCTVPRGGGRDQVN